jgi:hypothetical protein
MTRPATMDRHGQAASALAAAVEAGLKVGTDGENLLIASPLSMPGDVYFPLQRALIEYQTEIIVLIERGRRHGTH